MTKIDKVCQRMTKIGKECQRLTKNDKELQRMQKIDKDSNLVPFYNLFYSNLLPDLHTNGVEFI